MNIEEIIKTQKPNLSLKSLKSYIKNIEKILKDTKSNNIEIFKNIEVITKFLDERKSYLTKRNYLNSIIVLLQHDTKAYNKEITLYQKIRDTYNDKYKNIQKTGLKSDKQKENWLSLKQINEIVEHLKQDLTDNQNLQWYFMLLFWLEYPIRNDLAYTEMISKKKYNKLLSAELELKNYFIIDKKPFISISQYKTYNKYGIKKIEINDEIKKILLQYLPINKTKYILYNIKNNSPMSTEDITISFNKLFSKFYPEKRVSTTMLRHIILTERYGKTLEEMKALASTMGHDIGTAHNIYIKKD